MDLANDDVGEQNIFATGVQWITTLRCALSNPLESKFMLDCYIFAEILHRIDDSYFSEDWIDKLSQYDQSASWRPKTRNLQKLLEKLFSYIREQRQLDLESDAYWKIDEQLFAECGDLKQLNKVIFLIVGAAFYGRNKVEFINVCQQQKTEIQGFVQTALLTIGKHSQEATTKTDETVYSADTPARLSNGNGLSFRCDDEEFETAVERKVEERLNSEIEKVKEQLSNTSELKELRDEFIDLKSKKEQFENRAYEAEAEVDALRSNVDRKDAEIVKLKEMSSNSLMLEVENTNLKDELEELRSKDAENSRLTREVEKYKKIIKDSSEQKSELNVLREKVDRYMKDAVNLEEEKTKNVSLRQQIASLKVQKDEKEEEANKLSIRLNKLEAEHGEAKVNLAISEKKFSDAVHDKLLMQDRIKDLENSNNESGHVSLNNDVGILADSTSRVFELEKELSRMKERILELEELEDQKREWQQTKGRNSELEAELKISNAKKNELQETVLKLEQSIENRDTSQDFTVVNNLKMALEKAGIEYEKLKERFDDNERKFNSSSDEHQKMQKLIETRDEQLKKATQLIIDQENRLNSSTSDGLSRQEFDSLRRDCEQKDRLIQQMKDELDNIRTKHEEEQRLMTTAFHGMAGRVNEVSRVEQSLESSREKSFLAKQKASSAYRVSGWKNWLIAILFAVVMYQNITTPVSVPPHLF